MLSGHACCARFAWSPARGHAVSQEVSGSQLCHPVRGIHATLHPSRLIKTAGAVRLALLSSVRRRRNRGRVSALLRQARRGVRSERLRRLCSCKFTISSDPKEQDLILLFCFLSCKTRSRFRSSQNFEILYMTEAQDLLFEQDILFEQELCLMWMGLL